MYVTNMSLRIITILEYDIINKSILTSTVFCIYYDIRSTHIKPYGNISVILEKLTRSQPRKINISKYYSHLSNS